MELKPCPFCGECAHVRIADSNEMEGVGPSDEGYTSNPYHAVVCSFTDGGCGASGGYRSTEREAIEAWNRRPTVETCEVDLTDTDEMYAAIRIYECSKCGMSWEQVWANDFTFCPYCGRRVEYADE